MIEELKAAGYTDEQIEKEVRYAERVKLENERLRSDPAWNYGFVGPDDAYNVMHRGWSNN